MSKAFLKRKIATRIANGHPWIFANEVEKIEENTVAGDIVEVFYFDGKAKKAKEIQSRSGCFFALDLFHFFAFLWLNY
jgi:23S rRNA (cytosine1962-C5)-methyltransferase